MGFFSKSKKDEFSDKFIETYNFLASYSYGKLSISNSLAESKATVQFRELIEIAKQINNPYSETFSYYLSPLVKERLSIAEGLIMIKYLIFHAIVENERISDGFAENALSYSRIETHSQSGIKLINSLLI